MVSILGVVQSAARYAHKASWAFLYEYDRSIRRLGADLLMVLYIMHGPPRGKQLAATLQSLSVTTMKDTNTGKFLQWAEPKAEHFILFYFN